MVEHNGEPGPRFDWAVAADVGLPVLNPESTLWSIQMWFGGCGSSLELLYTMVAPFTEPTRRWVTKDLDNPLSITAIVGGEWARVCEFLTSMSNGRTIGQAASAAGFQDAPPMIAELALRDCYGLYGQGSVLQETQDSRTIISGGRLAVSPSNDFPVAVRHLCLLDKRAILVDDSGNVDRNKARELLESLSKCTHLDFAGGDIERLGNLEVFHCLGAGAHEECFVKIEASRESIRVETTGGFTSDSDSLLIRCRQEARGHIMRDEMIPVALADGGGHADFGTMRTGPYSATIEIWTSLRDNWYLAWRRSFSFVRSFNFMFRVVGPRYTLVSPWLEKYSRNRSLAERASRVREIERYETEEIRTGAGTDEPVVVSHVNAMNLHSALFPPTSDALWLEKMRSDVDKPRLEFVEWFRKACDAAKSIVLVDPYFDSWGLEVVARLQQSGLEVTILSSESLRQADADALQRLNLHVSQLNPLLHKGFKLCIVPEGRIHDRYLLIEKGNGERLGYHLSNSLQNATQNYPLLITPIPQGVLDSVWSYIDNRVSDTSTVVIPFGVRSSVPRSPSVIPGPNGSLADALAAFRESTGDEIGPTWIHLSEHLARSSETAEQSDSVRDAIGVVGAGNLVGALVKLPIADDPSIGSSEGRAQNAVRWTRMGFREAIENDSVERLGFEHSGHPWWLTYGAEFLASYFPNEFIQWVDAEISALAGSEGAADYPRRMVVYRLRQRMISSTDIEWSGQHPNGVHRRELISILLNSDAVAVRALAAVSLLQPSDAVDNEILAQLRTLSTAESIEAHKWLISTMLDDATRDTEGEIDLGALPLAVNSLLSLGLDEESLLAFVERLVTKVPGRAYPLIDEHIIWRAHEAGICTSESHEVWVRILSSRICDNEPFRGWRDNWLTTLSAWHLAKLPSARTGSSLVSIRRELRRCSRVLRRPFPRGRKYTEWREARDTVCWIQSVARIAILNDVEDTETQHAIEEILRDTGIALGKECDEEPSKLSSDIEMFSTAVRKEYLTRE